jgi:hypothetical protein
MRSRKRPASSPSPAILMASRWSFMLAAASTRRPMRFKGVRRETAKT